MSKLQRWLRGDAEPVRKGVAQVESAFFAWAAEVAEEYDLYEDGGDDGAADAYVPKQYSLSRLGETSRGALWCACDYYWGSVYIIENGSAAEVVVAKSRDEKVMLVAPEVSNDIDLDALGNDTEAEVLKWAANTPAPTDYRVVKAEAEQKYTLGVAYPADEIDSHGDFTSRDELEKAAWGFMANVIAKNDPGVGTDHADGTGGAARVVESYIYRGPDWVDEESGETIAKSGDWLVGAIWTDDGWERVKKDELTGWSIQGLAYRNDTEEAPEDGVE